MGKKKIISQTNEQLIKETDNIEEAMKRASDKTKETARAGFIKKGRIYVSATYNNTIITLTDEKGGVLGWASSGAMGFKGSKKATPYAAGKVAEIVAQKIKKEGIDSVNFYVKGIGSGRDAAARAFLNNGININMIKDITPVPHNGCRPPKVRRV